MEPNDKEIQEQTLTDNEVNTNTTIEFDRKEYDQLLKEHNSLKAQVAEMRAAQLENKKKEERKKMITELTENILADPEVKRNIALQILEEQENVRKEGLERNEQLFDHVFKTFRRQNRVYTN